jgi:hypothetical protein
MGDGAVGGKKGGKAKGGRREMNGLQKDAGMAHAIHLIVRNII